MARYKFENWHLMIAVLIILGLYGGGYLDGFIGAVIERPSIDPDIVNVEIFKQTIPVPLAPGNSVFLRMHKDFLPYQSTTYGYVYDPGLISNDMFYFKCDVPTGVPPEYNFEYLGPAEVPNHHYYLTINNWVAGSQEYSKGDIVYWEGDYGPSSTTIKYLCKQVRSDTSYAHWLNALPDVSSTTWGVIITNYLNCDIPEGDITYTCYEGSTIKLAEPVPLDETELCYKWGFSSEYQETTETCPNECILGATQTETCWDGTTITTNECVHNWFGNTWEATGDDCTADPCLTKTCPTYCDGTTYYNNGDCQIGECNYNVALNAPECQPEAPNPCDGVTCSPDTCVDTTKIYGGVCNTDTGNCDYSQEINSVACGYNPCEGVSCPDKCDGTTYSSQGMCQDGDCIYNEVPESNLCIIDPCADVECESNTCEGTTRVYGGQCDINTAECVYSREENSATCGYQIPLTQDDINQGTDPLSEVEQDAIGNDITPATPIEEPSFIKTYWWLFLLIAAAIIGYIIYNRR